MELKIVDDIALRAYVRTILKGTILVLSTLKLYHCPNYSATRYKLEIELEWYEQLWAFTLDKSLNIPFSHIVSVTSAEPQSNWAEIRAPGTFLPGVIKAGTYYSSRGKEFWYVPKEQDYFTLELRDESYKRIIVTIDNSEQWVERIRGLLG